MMLAIHIALRELRGGLRDFRLFLACLVLGVAVIAAVGSASQHIEGGIRGESKTLLGGDVELSLTNLRATPEQLAFLQSYGRVSLTASLRAMASFGDSTSLVEIKGVDSNYPLLGQAILASHAPLQKILARGGIVAGQGLLNRLNIPINDTVTLGITILPLVDILQKEPDSIANPLSLGPRVMASFDTLEKNGFLQPANLVRYHYHLLLNDASKLEVFKQALAQTFPHAPWIVKTVSDNNRGIQEFVERLQLFMTLAGLSALLIGGIGIMNATETYLSRQSETIAIMKTLGAKRHFIFAVYIIILWLITLAGSATGALLGVGLSAFALPYLAGFLPVFDTRFSLDIPSLLLAMGFGILTVFTFSIAALGRGIEIKPALLFRGRDLGKPRLSPRKLAMNILLASGLIATLIFSSHDKKIAIGFIAAALASFAIFALAASLIKKLARKIHPDKPWLRLAIANLHRPGAHTLSIMLSIGIGLTVLIALLLVEGNFQREVDETMPSIAPSLFLIDIQPAQKDNFIAFLKSHDYISDIAQVPMIRGRISRLKNIPVEKINIDSDAKWAIENDRGVTYATTPPANSRITEGVWWPSDYRGKTLVSLDRKLASGMGLHIGDSITVNILGKDIDAEISSLREINYLSFQINFAMIFSPGPIEQFPASYIATVHIRGDKNEAALVREVAKQFPNISSIRLRDSIAQIKELIGHIAVALRACATVTLISGIMVLASALAATLNQRIYDTVILKVVGARKSDILKMFLSEWLLLAAVTALISCILGSCGAWLILRRLDWIEFQVIPSAMATAIVLSLAFITLTGFIIHSRVFSIKAAGILRNE